MKNYVINIDMAAWYKEAGTAATVEDAIRYIANTLKTETGIAFEYIDYVEGSYTYAAIKLPWMDDVNRGFNPYMYYSGHQKTALASETSNTKFWRAGLGSGASFYNTSGSGSYYSLISGTHRFSIIDFEDGDLAIGLANGTGSAAVPDCFISSTNEGDKIFIHTPHNSSVFYMYEIISNSVQKRQIYLDTNSNSYKFSNKILISPIESDSATSKRFYYGDYKKYTLFTTAFALDNSIPKGFYDKRINLKGVNYGGIMSAANKPAILWKSV